MLQRYLISVAIQPQDYESCADQVALEHIDFEAIGRRAATAFDVDPKLYYWPYEYQYCYRTKALIISVVAAPDGPESFSIPST